MKFLLTGATGFLGSHLLRGLLEIGHEVAILKRSFSNTWRIYDLLNNVDYYDLDKCNLDEPFKTYGRFDAVIHTAACYGRQGESTLQILETNTLFPLKLLETAAHYNTTAFLNTDTFFNQDKMLYKYLNGYVLSKKQFLEWGRQISLSEKIRFINVRLEHVYGPKDSDSKFTTHVMKSCVNNIPELLLTAGEQKRDFIFVDDVVSAYLILLQAEQGTMFQNAELGTGTSVSIRHFVETVHSISNSSTFLKFGALPYREGEIMDSSANTDHLTKLGWAPKIKLSDGIKVCIKDINT